MLSQRPDLVSPKPHPDEGSEARRRLPVFIVGKVRLYGEGLMRILSEEGSLEPVGFGPPDESSLQRIESLKPRVALVDTGSARNSGFIQAIAAAAPGCSVIALAVTNDEAEVLGCAEAGVAGYIAAGASTSDLVESLRTLQCGAFPCPSATASILLRHLDPPSARHSALPGADAQLTRRETDVLALVERGFTNKQIAESLAIELSTVKNHVHNILGKLGVARRFAAVAKLRPLSMNPKI